MNCRRAWIAGRYKPTHTIIEAARHLYANHSVADIVRTEARRCGTPQAAEAEDHEGAGGQACWNMGSESMQSRQI
jgi:hypothetical protein